MQNDFYNIFYKSMQTKAQKQIIDYNYTTNLFFTGLSTLESLKYSVNGCHKTNYKNKLFAHYDKVNYSHKTTQELRSQLQVHLNLLRSALIIYNKDFKDGWQSPQNFNNKTAQQFIFQALNQFRSIGDVISQKLCLDFIEIMKNNFNDLFIDKNNLSVEYSQQQREGHMKKLLENSTNAVDIMAHEKGRVQLENHKDHRQISGNLNPDYQKIVNAKQFQTKYLIITRADYKTLFKEGEFIDINCLQTKELYESLVDAKRKITEYNRNSKTKHYGWILLELEIRNDYIISHTTVS